MNQEYFTIQISSEINLGISLVEMGTVAQFETKNICTVPGVAEFWHGVANFKGSLLWILDSDRFFALGTNNSRAEQKLTAVILKQGFGENQKRVAIVAQQLTGIISVATDLLKPLKDNANAPPVLGDCCSVTAQTGDQTTYIIDSVAFLQQLNQQSTLITA